jgi:hypothetical protein
MSAPISPPAVVCSIQAAGIRSEIVTGFALVADRAD